MVKKYSESKIFEILKEYEAGISPLELCRKHGMSKAALYSWKNKYQGMDLSDIKRLKHLEEENRRLKTLYANLSLDNQILKEALGKKF